MSKYQEEGESESMMKRTVKNCSSPDCNSEHLSRACERKDCNVNVCLNAMLSGGYCSQSCKDRTHSYYLGSNDNPVKTAEYVAGQLLETKVVNLSAK